MFIAGWVFWSFYVLRRPILVFTADDGQTDPEIRPPNCAATLMPVLSVLPRHYA